MSTSVALQSMRGEFASVMLSEYPDSAAAVVEYANPEASVQLLAEASTEVVASILKRLTPDRASELFLRLPHDRVGPLAHAMSHNRVAALLARVSEAERESWFVHLDESEANELRELISYPADTAGALMDPRVTSFRPDALVRDVIARLRDLQDRRPNDLYVVGEDGKLLGRVPLDEVVLAPESSRLDGLVGTDRVALPAIASRDEIIETFESHRVASLPVVDFDGNLLGVLRHRDIVEAAQREATASSVTMVGASEQERALSSPVFAIRKRLPWLQINLLTAFLAAAVVGLFEDTIASVTALAVLLPVVAGQSGNTGAQALAVTMRGLALREVRVRHWWQVVTKESLAGLGNGVAVAATTSFAVFLWSGSPGLCAVIGVSMVISMTLAGLSGAAIPMLLTVLRQDPAQSSSILLTTVTDVVGFFSFLGIATIFMSVL